MEIHGWLILDKPLGFSSTQVLGKIRRSLRVKKIGHVGTLDPLATGVLVVAVGEATKLIPFLPTGPKIYDFVVRWGEARDTDDAEGKVIHTSSVLPTLKAIQGAVKNFVGTLDQVPPLYSAIKNQGQPAYKTARKGGIPPLNKRSVTIYDLKIMESIDLATTRFQVKCAGGTYVRALARDLALYLGTYGHVQDLRRLKDGLFSIQDTICMEKFSEVVHKSEDYPFLKSIETVLDDIPAVLLSSRDCQRIRQGLDIEADVYGIETSNLSMFSLFYDHSLVAMAVLQERRLYPRRVFNLNLL